MLQNCSPGIESCFGCCFCCCSVVVQVGGVEYQQVLPDDDDDEVGHHHHHHHRRRYHCRMNQVQTTTDKPPGEVLTKLQQDWIEYRDVKIPLSSTSPGHHRPTGSTLDLALSIAKMGYSETSKWLVLKSSSNSHGIASVLPTIHLGIPSCCNYHR